MKMKGAKAVHYEAGPNMTPLVDVVMVILIFLMLAGKFGGQEHFLVSNMPISGTGGGASSGSAISVDEPVQINVSSPTRDRFKATDNGQQVNATSGEELTKQLRALHERMNKAGKATKDIQVKIAPSRNVRFEHVVAVQEAAMRAKFEKVGFVAAQ